MITAEFIKIKDQYNEAGRVDYNRWTSPLLNACQTHFYRKNIFLGIQRYQCPGANVWENFSWRKLYTDKFINATPDERGAFEVNGNWVKDQYYDLSKACIPYMADPKLIDYINDVKKNNEDMRFFYDKKPPVMAYLVACVEHNNSAEFPYYFDLLRKNSKRFDNLD